MIDIKDALKRFRIGDPITDEEIKELIKLYQSTIDNLKVMGDYYNIVVDNMSPNLNLLLSYKHWRNQDVRKHYGKGS